mgnify:FL=1
MPTEFAIAIAIGALSRYRHNLMWQESGLAPVARSSHKERSAVKHMLVVVMMLWAGAAVAQDSKLNIELNSIAARDNICQVYIRVLNQTDAAYDVFKIDLAFFDKGGVINDRVLVDLAPLRARKTSIHVFDMPDLDCNNVGEVLLNDITECKAAEGAKAPDDCFAAVALSAKGDIRFIR